VSTEPDHYDPSAIEPPIARRWAQERTYSLEPGPQQARPEDDAGLYYALTMFPYPSGDLHMGHAEIFTIHDALVRHLRMTGRRVLNPIGWDAFGLPAENAARNRGADPRAWTYANIDEQRSTIVRLGYSFDWDTVLHTCDPDYYRWTQWLFLELFDAGLAYRREAAVNWCGSCGTVLANEQVIDGRCERCGTEVVRKPLTQWFFRITDYADELLAGLETIDWPERVKNSQRFWIGRSEGAEVTFTTADAAAEPIVVYTTRPDTLYGATYFVFAPEHPLVVERMGDDPDYQAFVAEVARRSEVERLSSFAGEGGGRAKRGLRLGFDMINPVTGETIAAYAADYVLMDYGTGAIMAVPAHDQRDLDFARQEGLEVRVVVQPDDGTAPDGATMTEAFVGDGVSVNSGGYDGLDWRETKQRITADLADDGLARATVNYRLRDWLVSRQRFWGAPIPIIHCDECGLVGVPEQDLPVLLPDPEEVDFRPRGESPLASHPDWSKVECPTCGGEARRDTDTMDTFVDSSWYFLRYCSPDRDDAAFDRGLITFDDDRRLVLPIAYFLDNPVENWTRNQADVLGTVFLHVDYTVPLAPLREKLKQLVAEHPDWDGRVAEVIMFESHASTLELRALVSSRESGAAWRLRVHVREGLVSFLQQNHPEALPRFRIEWEDSLNHSLADMGMAVAFTGNADFSAMTPGGGLYISMVKQKTFVEVNEEGTEAAAVTVVEMSRTSAGMPELRFDRPFLFAIRDSATRTVLFLGTVMDPKA
jgi:leucyl-tRNA synthetase